MAKDLNTFDLDHPITVGGREIKTVTLRRPKLRDFERIETIDNDLLKSKQLVGDLGEMSPEEVAELDIADFKKMADRVGEIAGELGD